MKKTNIIYMISFLIVVSIGITFRFQDFNHDIDGMHTFRQSHVASNIELLMKDGIFSSPNMYAKNNSYKFFDYPLYQQIVAVLCNSFDTPVVQTGRVFNIIIYLLNSLIFWGILRIRCKFSERVAFVTILLYSVSPLSIFYERAIIPDNLAILLSFLSLWFFLGWDENGSKYSFSGMIVSGILASLIKPPIYFPVCITICFYFVMQHRFRQLYSSKMVFFGALISTTIVTFKLYSNYINTGALRTPVWEYQWYFATLGARLDPNSYEILFQRLASEIVAPAIFILFLLGLGLFRFGKQHSHQRGVIIGLAIGGLVTPLLFFNVNLIHNYYQLPFVFISCFFAAYAWDRILGQRMIAVLRSEHLGDISFGCDSSVRIYRCYAPDNTQFAAYYK